MQVSLRFGANGCDSEAPELSRISIAMAANDEPRVFVRGQLAFGQSHGTFPWTSGVHALSLLFLEAAIRQITDGNGSVESETFCQSTEPQLLGPHLIGERGSPATTLDFALSKRPAWLLELFGATTSGASVLSRYVVVKNSNGKRPGPTEIWLKPAVNVQIVDPSSTGPLSTAELKELLAQLHKNWKPYGVRKVASRSLPASKAHYKTSDQATVGSSPQSFKDVLCKLYEPELSQCLEAFDPFNARSYKQQLERLVTDSSFKKVAGNKPFALAEDALSLPPSAQRGIVDIATLERALAQKPIRVAIGMANIGPLAIFSHLAQSSKLPFVIDNSFVHALEIATRILKQDPLIDHDLVSIASAPAASLIASGKLHDYVPLMFLPVARQQLVRARSVGRKRQQSLCGGTISLLHAEPSTVSFCFESLVENSTIKERNFSKLHHQPWETAELLASGDPEVLSLLFFPYAELHQWAQIAELVPALSSEARTAEVILFAKREFLADRARFFATVAAIRGAWASLRDCSASQKAAISGFVNRANYAKNMFRASGLDVTSASALAPEAYLS